MESNPNSANQSGSQKYLRQIQGNVPENQTQPQEELQQELETNNAQDQSQSTRRGECREENLDAAQQPSDNTSSQVNQLLT